jgi:hypothetical protein
MGSLENLWAHHIRLLLSLLLYLLRLAPFDLP